MKKCLHIISFDNPYPANYGGAIDVYYKLQSLKKAGCYIILHIFQYGDVNENRSKLYAVSDEIYFYKRKTGILSNLGFLPYIVYSRRDKKLLDDLLKDEFPIFFEGLHSCWFLNHPLLKNRMKLVRLHNIEHKYYYSLVETANTAWKKLYYKIEGLRLKWFEANLKHANVLFPISKSDELYFSQKFSEMKIELLPCFTNTINIDKTILHNTLDYVLYHGNLSVEENQKAAYYLLNEVVPLSDKNQKWIFAGNNPPLKLVEAVNLKSNVTLIANPTDEDLADLIAQAKANILITFQSTGIKLKLLNALYQGGFCIVNSTMLVGTDVDDLCIIADTPQQMADAIKSLAYKRFIQKDKDERFLRLSTTYSNEVNVKIIIAHC